MDKETLSHYGWIAIVLMCMTILITMATPFGKYIGITTNNVADGIQSVGDDIDRENMNNDMENLFLSDSINSGVNVSGSSTLNKANDIIPQGGLYLPENDLSYTTEDGYITIGPMYRGGPNQKYTPSNLDVNKLSKYKPSGGDAFPEPKTGDVFIYGNYQYVYNAIPYDMRHRTVGQDAAYEFAEIDGWMVMEFGQQTVAQPIFDEINGKKVKNIDWLFFNNTKLVDASKFNFPIGVSETVSVFNNCTSLQKAPTIPPHITTVTRMFLKCTSLKGNITINTNPTNYGNFFAGVNTDKINIVGTTTLKNELLKTDTKETTAYNKTVYVSCCETLSLIYEDGMTLKEYESSPYFDKCAIYIQDDTVSTHRIGPPIKVAGSVDAYGNNHTTIALTANDNVEDVEYCSGGSFLKDTIYIEFETQHNPYDNNIAYQALDIWDMRYIEGIKSVDIVITYQTESVSYDWVSLAKTHGYVNGNGSASSTHTYLTTNGTLTTTNGSASSVRFGGKTSNANELITVEFKNVDMLYGTAIFRTDSSVNQYYGAKITIFANCD